MEDCYCVYCHTNKINGKKYIGKTKDISCRWSGDGRGYLYSGLTGKNTVFSQAIQKYGWDNFSHEILADGLNSDEASELERQLIAEYRTNVRLYGTQYGYNMTDGGDGAPGRFVSQESKKKMSESHLGLHQTEESKRKISNTLKGRDTLSPEIRATLGKKISASLKGRKLSSDHIENIRAASKLRPISQKARENSRLSCIKKVRCIETGEVFDSMKDACDKYNINPPNLTSACTGRRKTTAGLHWEYIQ